MSKPVLVLAKGDDPQLKKLNGIPHTIVRNQPIPAEKAIDVSAILNWSGARELLRTAFSMCPHLRWVHSRSAGVDNVLFPELVESDVILTNSRGVFSASLGEFALAAILYFAKDFRRMIRNQSAEVWQPFDVEAIAERTVGIVGYGDIGTAVGARASAMGMRVLALKRHAPQQVDPVIEQFHMPAQLHQMLSHCDYVVVAAPLTKQTRHMISTAEFAAMKPTAVVINVGRGPVIHEAALVQALASGKIKGAALDVFEQEPLPAGHPLYRMENVLLSPHCADNTLDWKDRAMSFFLDQYRRFENGEPLENIVNKRLGY
jgi:phosphoglycerate dehydrogenase-like enzyme